MSNRRVNFNSQGNGPPVSNDQGGVVIIDDGEYVSGAAPPETGFVVDDGEYSP